MSTLIAMQQPELINGVVFSAPSILPPVGFILVCALDHAVVTLIMHVSLAWYHSCHCCYCSTTANTTS